MYESVFPGSTAFLFGTQYELGGNAHNNASNTGSFVRCGHAAFFREMHSWKKNGIGELRHFEANNSYRDSFDDKMPSVFGVFFDVASLYAGTMLQMLPLDQYAWNYAITLSKIVQTDEDSPVGYFVDVDLEYPASMQDKHSDLPWHVKSS